MLALTLAATLFAGLPAEAPQLHSRPSRLGYPWLGFTYGMGGHAPPFINVRPYAGVRTAWDIVEFGGALILGGNPVEGFAGGLGYLTLTPYPVGVGRIFYVRGGLGRIHRGNAVFRSHEGIIEATLGFRIPTDGPLTMAGAFLYIEAGVQHRRRCQDWAMPCTTALTRWWPMLAFGITFL